MKKQHIKAFSLVEITLAIGVTAFCLLSLIALLPVAQKSHIAASEQTGANDVTSEIISDLRATQKTVPPTTQNSPRFQLMVETSGSSPSAQTLYFREGNEVIGPPGTSAVGANPAPRYRATIFLNPPANGRIATFGRILLTWPALADPNPDATPSNNTGSLETFIALDRN